MEKYPLVAKNGLFHSKRDFFYKRFWFFISHSKFFLQFLGAINDSTQEWFNNNETPRRTIIQTKSTHLFVHYRRLISRICPDIQRGNSSDFPSPSSRRPSCPGNSTSLAVQFHAPCPRVLRRRLSRRELRITGEIRLLITIPCPSLLVSAFYSVSCTQLRTGDDSLLASPTRPNLPPMAFPIEMRKISIFIPR